ncbi:hypothetical protein ABZ299_25470 [Streptomyces sp. NPDC006184]
MRACTRSLALCPEADLVVERNRFGPTAYVTVAARLHYSRFVDMAHT